MHVNKAFDVFAPSVTTAMEIYSKRDDLKEDLEDRGPTIKFLKTVNKVIEAMTSRTSMNALRLNNSAYDVIISFRQYMLQWKILTGTKDYVFLSENTYIGFMVTLKSAIEVMTFLCTECKYSFLMTARLNQDALEGMFGMIRGCCGSHDNPDPLLFIQVYRLLSFYSLVKPPKGSNVDGMEIFETLLNEKDTKVNENKKEWTNSLNYIIERGENNNKEYTVRHAHDYNVSSTNEFVQAYFSGFLCRKIEKWTKCESCISSVTKPAGNLPRDEMINSLSRGYLKYPSENLFNLLSTLENAILLTVGQEQLNFYTFQHIMQNILSESIVFVGCEEHKSSLTKTVINYYAVTRTKIICKNYNNVYDEAKKEEKKYRKMSKLVGKKDNSSEGTTKTVNNGYKKEPKKTNSAKHKGKIVQTVSNKRKSTSKETSARKKRK